MSGAETGRIYSDEINPVMGERVRRFRDAFGLTQRDLALKLALNRSSIANIESGRQALTVPSLITLADIFETTIGVIAGLEPMPDLPRIPAVTVTSTHIVTCELCGEIGSFAKQIDANRSRDEHRKPHPSEES